MNYFSGKLQNITESQCQDFVTSRKNDIFFKMPKQQKRINLAKLGSILGTPIGQVRFCQGQNILKRHLHYCTDNSNFSLGWVSWKYRPFPEWSRLDDAKTSPGGVVQKNRPLPSVSFLQDVISQWKFPLYLLSDSDIILWKPSDFISTILQLFLTIPL